MTAIVYTVGHSTHPIDEFVQILQAHGIELLADVRTIPKSRHNPQFNKEELQQELQRNGIEYMHLPELGGLRHLTKDSINTGWRNSSFRGYADYMQTEEFKAAIEKLIALAAEKRTAIMCAEAVPWRCHRSLIGDALLVRGLQVNDIMSEKSASPHKLTPWAHVEGVSVTYPEPKQPTDSMPTHGES
jgi:uncharacterized protein (DUF488 family)